EDKPDDKKDKGKADWRSVLAKYGLTEKDLEPKDAVEKLNFVRVDGGFTVPTDENTVLFFGNDGKYLAALPVRSEGLVGAAVGNSQLELGSKDVQGEKHQAVDFKFAIPLDQKNQKRGADLKLTVVLEAAPQPKEAPWRLPVEIKPAPGAASKNANSATPGVTGGATREQLR
ncbi:MAG TPA: hypothetical protein VK348_00270, partial [Planctomycetota bacterium]|nr:hypothetical protein [Planctomycetota bacterium]